MEKREEGRDELMGKALIMESNLQKKNETLKDRLRQYAREKVKKLHEEQGMRSEHEILMRKQKEAKTFLEEQRKMRSYMIIATRRWEEAKRIFEEQQAKRSQEILYAEKWENLKMSYVTKAYQDKKGENPRLRKELYRTEVGVFPWHSSEVEKSEELFEQIGRELGIKTKKIRED